MDNSLIELIDGRIKKMLASSNFVNSQIGQVISVGNGVYQVKLFTTGATYALPNYSGTEISVGEKVYVYWSGGFLSNQSAYIGAALTKEE